MINKTINGKWVTSMPKKKPMTRKKPIRKKRLVVKKPEPEVIFRGTSYEMKIWNICSRNKFPFDLRRAKIKNKVVDFIYRKKRLIIEVYNPERSDEELYARMKIFHIQRFKVCYITQHDLLKPKWREFCTGIIRGFLSHD